MQPGEPPAKEPDPTVVAEVQSLVKRAKSGDVAALPRLRELLAGHDELWQSAGDLEKHVTTAWIRLVSDNPLTAEALKLKAEKLRAQLEGDAPTPLESLMVGQVVIAWLELGHAQIMASRPGTAPIPLSSHNLKRMESALKRYLAAMKTLTTLRALVPQGLVPASPLRIYEPRKKPA